ncbi:unnamed protein product [Meloidogyne enterolobii]|uniref:Uncharacterized protein n=2 Tax=Meloidogyne enterolobii TaxID=390850 RepID=A0ACB1AJE0_MELEN
MEGKLVQSYHREGYCGLACLWLSKFHRCREKVPMIRCLYLVEVVFVVLV